MPINLTIGQIETNSFEKYKLPKLAQGKNRKSE